MAGTGDDAARRESLRQRAAQRLSVATKAMMARPAAMLDRSREPSGHAAPT
jgi:hypothetical protein